MGFNSTSSSFCFFQKHFHTLLRHIQIKTHCGLTPDKTQCFCKKQMSACEEEKGTGLLTSRLTVQPIFLPSTSPIFMQSLKTNSNSWNPGFLPRGEYRLFFLGGWGAGKYCQPPEAACCSDKGSAGGRNCPRLRGLR